MKYNSSVVVIYIKKKKNIPPSLSAHLIASEINEQQKKIFVGLLLVLAVSQWSILLANWSKRAKKSSGEIRGKKK